MAIDTVDDELLDDEEEQQRKKPQQQSVGKPIVGPTPPQGVPVGGGQTSPVGAPIFPKSTGAAQPTPAPEVSQSPAPATMPSVGGSIVPTPSPSNVGTPINVPAPRPAGERAEALAQQGPPEYHGIKRFLDTLGGATNIGRAVENASGMGTVGYEGKLGRAEGAANVEEKGIQAGEKERQANAETELRGAQTGEAQAREEATRAGQIPVTIPGVSVPVPQSQLGRVLGPQETGQSRMAVEMSKETAAEKLQKGRPISMDDLGAQAIKENDQATLQKVEDAKKQIAAAGKQEPGNFIPVNDALGNVTGWVNPKSRDWVPAGSIAGGAVVQAAGGAGAGPTGGGVIPPKPNAIEKRMVDMAHYAGSLIDDAIPMINDARSQLGPGAGRWSEFTAGKVGLKNVDWTGINAQMTMINGAMTLAHSQGRVSNLIYDSFHRLYDAGKQDPDNLIEALSIAKRALGHVGEAMGGVPAQGQTPTAHTPGKLPDGAIPGKMNGKSGYLLNGQFHAN